MRHRKLNADQDGFKPAHNSKKQEGITHVHQADFFVVDRGDPVLHYIEPRMKGLASMNLRRAV